MSGTTNFVSDLQNAARENPVSALLIGSGLAWMFLGGARLKDAASMLEPVTAAVARNAGRAMDASANAASSVADGVRSMTTAVADKSMDAVGEMNSRTASAYDSIKDKTSTIGDFATETALSPVVENLKRAFERQPLLIGGVGLAIGSAIAAALPRTTMEDEALGDMAQRVSSEAGSIGEAAINDVADRAERAFDAMSEEASAQGLTSEAAKSGAADIGRKLKDVASAARSSSKL